MPPVMTDPAEDRLRAARPQAAEIPADAAESAEARALLARVRTEAVGEAAGPARPRPVTLGSWSRHRLRVAAAGGVCIVLVGVAAATLPDGTPPVSVLDAAAASAASQQPLRPTAGTYAYLRVRQESLVEPRLAGMSPDSGWTTELWIGADGSGRIVKTTSLSDGETPVGDGWKRSGKSWTREVPFGAGRLPAVYRSVTPTVLGLSVDALPTDPEALAELLRRELAKAAGDSDPETGFRHPRSSSGEMLIVIGQILAHPLAAPSLRSALYEVAGTLDGVQVEENVHDPAGRQATVIRLDETESGTPLRYELFFEPRTSAMLATRFTTSESFTLGGPTRSPDRALGRARPERSDSRPSGCGTAHRPCPAKVMKDTIPSDGHGHAVRTTFTDLTLYERGSVDSIHARP